MGQEGPSAWPRAQRWAWTTSVHVRRLPVLLRASLVSPSPRKTWWWPRSLTRRSRGWGSPTPPSTRARSLRRYATRWPGRRSCRKHSSPGDEEQVLDVLYDVWTSLVEMSGMVRPMVRTEIAPRKAGFQIPAEQLRFCIPCAGLASSFPRNTPDPPTAPPSAMPQTLGRRIQTACCLPTAVGGWPSPTSMLMITISCSSSGLRRYMPRVLHRMSSARRVSFVASSSEKAI